MSEAGVARREEAGAQVAERSWPWRLALLLSVAGLGVSAYLTAAHYATGAILACPSSGGVNCERVTTSAESMLFGIPVAVLGMAWFLGMIALSLPQVWALESAVVRRGRVAMVWAGMAFVVWLVYAELFRIRAICLWCTAVHVITFALFALVLLAGPGAAPVDDS